MNRLTEYLDKHLVPEWRKAWQWSSVQLAAAFGALVTAFSAQPDLLLGIIAFMPADAVTRALMAVGVGLTAFFGPTLVRLWDQSKDKTDDQA